MAYYELKTFLQYGFIFYFVFEEKKLIFRRNAYVQPNSNNGNPRSTWNTRYSELFIIQR